MEIAMFKTLAAALTAAALVVLPPAPVAAQTQNDELNRTILTLLALGAVGLAMKNSQEQSKESRMVAPPVQVHDNDRAPRRYSNTPDHSNGRGNAWGRAVREVDLIPGRCFRRIETGRGQYQDVYTARCLDRRYRDVSSLPRQCEVNLGGRDGNGRGYDASCLADYGFRSDQRWN